MRSQADRARVAVRVRGLADLDGGDGLVQARDCREAVEAQHLAHAREALDGREHHRRAARRDLREVAHLAPGHRTLLDLDPHVARELHHDALGAGGQDRRRVGRHERACE